MNYKMNITEATRNRNNLTGQFGDIIATIDGVIMSVPLDPANRHYAAIMEMVDAGELTIAEADA